MLVESPSGQEVVLELSAKWIVFLGNIVASYIEQMATNIQPCQHRRCRLLSLFTAKAKGIPEHMSHTGEISPRTVRRIAARIARHGATIGDIARIIEADASGRPPIPAGMPEGGRRMIEIAASMAIVDAAPVAIIMGRHCIAARIAPGPRMGRIVKAAFEAQIDGAFEDEAGGIAWIAAVL